MKQGLITIIVGFLFSVGLATSGMTQPGKVIAFLDIFGNWDPSLAFVMIGAIGVHAISFPLVTKRKTPFFSDSFQIPDNNTIDRKLLLGAFLFGIGWALGGYCPGPAVASIATFDSSVILFVGAMILGMLIQGKLAARS